jgi:hypothetical protein
LAAFFGAGALRATFVLVVLATFLDFLALFAPIGLLATFALRVIAFEGMLPCIMPRLY